MGLIIKDSLAKTFNTRIVDAYAKYDKSSAKQKISRKKSPEETFYDKGFDRKKKFEPKVQKGDGIFDSFRILEPFSAIHKIQGIKRNIAAKKAFDARQTGNGLFDDYLGILKKTHGF